MNTNNQNPQECASRRRRWTPEEKRAAVEKTKEPGRTVSSVAREYGIFPSQLLLWRRNMENGAFMGISEEGLASTLGSSHMELDAFGKKLFWVSDIFSSSPGWIEGCLESVESLMCHLEREKI